MTLPKPHIQLSISKNPTWSPVIILSLGLALSLFCCQRTFSTVVTHFLVPSGGPGSQSGILKWSQVS